MGLRCTVPHMYSAPLDCRFISVAVYGGNVVLESVMGLVQARLG